MFFFYSFFCKEHILVVFFVAGGEVEVVFGVFLFVVNVMTFFLKFI